MASPHYGERYGRHWLDAAGYVDTRGTDNNAAIIEPLNGIWKYRDYVIRAFNDDRPYDRFLLEQIAGDELVDWRDADRYQPRNVEPLIATGFLRQAADVTYAPELNTSDIRHQVVFDTIQNVTSNVLGLTVHCAAATRTSSIRSRTPTTTASKVCFCRPTIRTTGCIPKNA